MTAKKHKQLETQLKLFIKCFLPCLNGRFTRFSSAKILQNACEESCETVVFKGDILFPRAIPSMIIIVRLVAIGKRFINR
jgi:hypothetical protein